MKLQAQIINKRKSGISPVYIVCYLSGKRCRFLTGVEVSSTEWDNKVGVVTGRGKDAREKNLLINNTKKRITEIEIKYRLQNKTITADALMREFEVPTYEISFLDFYENELKKRKGSIASGTYEKHAITLKKLRDYKSDILFCDLDAEMITGFETYCRRTLKNVPNTINANLKNIKYYVRLAYKKKIIPDNPFEDIKISNITPERNFLTERELSLLVKYYNQKYISDVNKKVLRPFLFSCFTSLRYSDLEALRFDNIIDDMLVIQPIKTNYISKTVRIPLCEFAKKLIDTSKKTKHVFSMYCSQVNNRKMKDICELVGIKKTITFHVARHTFATMYLRKTNDLRGLQKILGHANISETIIYTHVMDEDLQQNVKALDIF